MADSIPYLTFRHGDESLRFLSDGLGFELLRCSDTTTAPSRTLGAAER